jgi:O-acetyl-ADP-ribose deacetylase (regulator of RNase III)
VSGSLRDRFSIVVGDITHSDAEAIVNAANTTLLGGSGVDGAIHDAAGPELLAECRTLGGCETGQAKLTGGYRLKAKWVLHTPGPIWQGGSCGEAALLASCYRACLSLAQARGIRTVDFPSISTGVYGYPPFQAAPVALRAILEFLAEHDLPHQVRMVCHREETAAVYRQAWNLWYAESKADRM